MLELKDRIVEILHREAVGAETAVEVRSLAVRAAAPMREVRAMVAELRLEGVPVASSVRPPYGYFIPATEREASETISQLQSRIREIAKAARGIERGLRAAFPGSQLALRLEE